MGTSDLMCPKLPQICLLWSVSQWVVPSEAWMLSLSFLPPVLSVPTPS